MALSKTLNRVWWGLKNIGQFFRDLGLLLWAIAQALWFFIRGIPSVYMRMKIKIIRKIHNMDKITYYADDSSLGIKTVITRTGEREYLRNCKKIKGEYFTIGKDCFLVGDTWYRTNSGLIDKDYETNQWFLKGSPNQQAMLHGVVAFEKGKEVHGFFSPNPYKNVRLYNRNCALNKEILLSQGFVESKSDGQFYPENQKSKCDLILNILDHTGKGYNIEDNAGEFVQKVQLWENYPLDISEKIKEFSELLGNTTFGAEFECQRGYLPEYLQARNGIVICRDGSLKDESGKPGPEFVTVPYKGAKGIQSLINTANELSLRTEIGMNCSFHMHLGNLPVNKKYIVALYRLGFKIQNELFLMFPYYKANPKGIKHKNYNQKLSTLGIYTYQSSDLSSKEYENHIANAYRSIFLWLSEHALEPDPFDKEGSKLYKHPNNAKWDRHNRYFWLNFMNIIFSERRTIEFRVHTPTTNAQKVFNWLFICNAIARYAELYADKILTRKGKIKLSEVLEYYSRNYGEKGQFMTRYLSEYIESRKREFIKDYDKGDKVSQWDIEEDKKYQFPFMDFEKIFTP